MNMIAVASSSIAFIGYDTTTMLLRIAFRNGGTYDYYDVPQTVAQQLLNSGSKGTYYARFIKGKFNSQRTP